MLGTILDRISIITATLNSESTVRDCLDSVKNCQCDVEHIVVDGGSSDGTMDIVRSYPHISKSLSEDDNGIYDAMNKGITMSGGEVIGILNSDDFYACRNILKVVARIFTDDKVDSCYGNLQYVDHDNTARIHRQWRSGAYKSHSFYWGWMPPHPTFFVRRSIYEKYGMFNLDLGSAADYEIMLRFLLKFRISTIYIPQVLVKMRSGGVSNSSLINRIKANRMDRKAWRINGLKPYPWTTLLKPLRKIAQYKINYHGSTQACD